MNEIFIDQVSPEIINENYLTKFYNNGEFGITFLFKSNFNNTKYLRDYFSIILNILWVDQARKNRFILILDELNNNAIEYWSANDRINIFRFSAKNEWDNLIVNIEVEDQWNWKNAKKAIEMEELRRIRLEKWFDNHNSIRWRWLFLIITKLVDKLYFKDSDKWWLIVWVYKVLKISKWK